MAGGRLTTHVLDTANGRPAAGLLVQLTRVVDGSREDLASAPMNSDGRCDGPLLAGDDFRSGQYELDFHVGDYFRAAGTPVSEPPFLDVVTVRFGIAQEGQHYHVPLLVSPFAYSTYRGS